MQYPLIHNLKKRILKFFFYGLLYLLLFFGYKELLYQRVDSKLSQHEISKRNILKDEVKNEIIEKIEHWKRSKAFLKHLNINSVSGVLGTNPKYLSYVIKEAYHLNFNDFIAMLRMNYLLEEIKLNSTLLDYKISYISHLLGYKSPTTFTKTFKKYTGEFPSVYFKNIKNLS